MPFVTINDPQTLINSNGLVLWDEFFFPIYSDLSAILGLNRLDVKPRVDWDTFKLKVDAYLNLLKDDEIYILRGLGIKRISPAEWNKDPSHKSLMVFLFYFPMFSHHILNVNLLSHISIAGAENDLSIKTDASNFIELKCYIDEINRNRWNRLLEINESQSGVSNLGGVSEGLLELALASLIDGKNFFKTNHPKTKSYGDFVLMCLPNNLWLSVKSNFARERLLASGYSTDIVGVGYFTDKNEFVSPSKLRNLQRVGFLAMYIPDIPISDEQINRNTNTYDEVHDYYRQNGMTPPININGQEFIRKLSSLHDDLLGLLSEKDISKRNTLGL